MFLRTATTLASCLALVAGLSGCGDGGGFGLGSFAEVQVIVDNQESGSDSTVTVAFPSAVQSSVHKPVQVINPGNATLTIESIDWDRDPDTNEQLVNPYVEIDWKNNITDFPLTIDGLDSVGLNFDVVYEPPIGAPLDDFRKSVLLIKSDGRSDTGEELVPEIRITFTVPDKQCWPEVSPDNVILSATPISPDSFSFCVQNNVELASSGFEVTAISLENTDNEFQVEVIDNLPADVFEPSYPGYADLSPTECPGVSFEVSYKPIDYVDDDNRVVVFHSCGDPMLVDLTGILSQSSTYEVAYQHAQAFDFSTEVDNLEKTRSAQLTSLGPGAVTVKTPSIEPEEAAEFFSWTAWKPATGPDEEDVQVWAKEEAPAGAKTFPQGLTSGKGIRFDVTYSPVFETEPPNGQLVIPLNTPDPEEVRLDLFAGNPKAKLDIAPSTGSATVTTELGESHMGERHVVISNLGNGPLEVKDLVITNSVSALPADNWSLVDPPGLPFTPQPEELTVLTVAWDTAGVTDSDGETEILSVTYFDAFVGDDITETMALVMLPAGGGTVPVATLAASTESEAAAVGDLISITALQSEPGSHELTSGSFIWYLTAKPAGSTVRLNEEGAGEIKLVADVPGQYEVEVVLVSFGSGTFLVGEPASIVVDVVEAPLP